MKLLWRSSEGCWELSNAFMQGKLQVTGDLMKLMNLQTVFQTLPQAIGRLEREY